MTIENQGVCVKYAGVEGRGVFATRDFAKGEQIEVCPLLPLILDEHPDPELAYEWPESNLDCYVYDWAEHGSAIALGYGSLYNHSNKPNVDYTMLEEAALIVYWALRAIPAGEELRISYADEDERIQFAGGRYVKTTMARGKGKKGKSK